jgi:pilus assembly protein CpaF
VSLYKRLYGDQGAPVTEPQTIADRLGDLRQRVHSQLVDEMGPVMYDAQLPEEDLRRRVSETVQTVLSRQGVPLSAADRAELIKDITDDVVGYGPIDRFLKDAEVTDIMVNGPASVYVERAGKPVKTDVAFSDEAHLRRIIDKIVGEVGRRIDESSPMCDARLPDGSRVNAVIHPVALEGPFLTIRKFSEERLTVDDLIRLETLSVNGARLVQAAVVGRLNVIVSGGSATGKTTALNIFSSFIPPVERIVTIEDAKELQLHQDHILSLESRPPNIEGQGEVTIRHLVKNSLRMRPDRIIVGECRGGEALDMLQAMNTGHDGSLTTVHANSPADALARLETLVLIAGFDLPVRAIREQLASAIDVIVHMARLRDGTRRITHITEVQDMEGDEITLQDVFLFDWGMGVDDSLHHRGRLKATGVRPKFSEKLADFGIQLGGDIFDAEDFAGAPALPSPTKALGEGESSEAEETPAAEPAEAPEADVVGPAEEAAPG